jgi:hypothetical protein
MPPSLGEAVLHLVGDDSKLISTTNAAKTKAQSILGGIGTGMRAVGRGILATATAVTAIGVAVGTTIGPASDLNETITKVNVVFGDSADQVLKFGENSATALGMSKNAALAAAGTYGNLFRALGLTEDMSADMSTTLIGLAGDLASFNNMDPGVVLDSLRAGLTGETEPMKKLGININEMILKEKAMELGLYSGAGALDASAKAQASYALIMEQTSLAQGDFARTADGVANQQRILAASIENIKASIGTGLLPIIQKVLGGLSGYMGEFGTLISDSSMTLEEKVAKGGEIVGRMASGISEALPGMMESGIGILKALVTGILSALPALLPAIVQVLMSILNFLIEMLPILVEGALQIVLALAQGLAQALPAMIPAIVQMLMTIVQVLIENLPLLIDAGLQIIIGLIQGILAALPQIIEQLPVIIVTIVEVIIQSLPMILDAAIKIIFALIQGLISAIPQLIAAIPQIIMGIVNALIGGIPQLLEVGKNLMSGFWNGIKSMFTAIWDGIGNFVGGVVDKVKNFLGINSDSKVMIEMAHNFGGGWITGLSQMKNSVASAMEGFNESINLGGMENRLNAAGMMAGAGGRFASGSASSMGATSKTVNVTVNNPIGETAERSIKNQMQKLSYLGVID